MKTNVRLLALAFSVLMLFCLTACGGGENTSEPVSSDTSSDVEAPAGEDTADTTTADKEQQNTTAAKGDKMTTTKGKVTTTKGKVTTTKKGATTRPVDKSKWYQTEFYISTFMAPTSVEALAAYKEAGFTHVETAWRRWDASLATAYACDQVGLKCILQNYYGDQAFSGIGGTFVGANENFVKAAIQQMEEFDSCEGWYTWDEVTPEKFADCRDINKLFNKNDPKRLAYSIVFPSYGQYRWDKTGVDNFKESRFYEYVTNYVKTVDPQVLSFDYYPFQQHGGDKLVLQNCEMWKDMGLFRKLSMETGKPFWFYFQSYNMSNHTPDHTYKFTDQMRSVQMYYAIAYGAKELSYYDIGSVVCDSAGNKTADYEGIKALNKKVKNLGDFLFEKNSQEIYQFGVNAKNRVLFQLDDVAKSDLIADAPDNTIVSVFEDGSASKYVLVVNMNYKGSKKGVLTLKTNKNVRIYDHAKDKTFNISDKTKTIELALPAGECALYIVE